MADVNQDTSVDAVVPLATIPALTALKTVSMVRRPQGNSPQKVGSDIHYLVRLITVGGAQRPAHSRRPRRTEPELARWVADHVDQAFRSDLRYTLLRLRRNDHSPSAQARSDHDVAGVSILADAIRDHDVAGVSILADAIRDHTDG